MIFSLLILTWKRRTRQSRWIALTMFLLSHQLLFVYAAKTKGASAEDLGHKFLLTMHLLTSVLFVALLLWRDMKKRHKERRVYKLFGSSSLLLRVFFVLEYSGYILLGAIGGSLFRSVLF